MTKVTFYIEREARHYVILDIEGNRMVDATFPTAIAAADMAHRFAQDNDMLPRFFMPLNG